MNMQVLDQLPPFDLEAVAGAVKMIVTVESMPCGRGYTVEWLDPAGTTLRKDHTAVVTEGLAVIGES